MSAESLTLRMISSLGRINQSNLRSGRLERTGLAANRLGHDAVGQCEDSLMKHPRSRLRKFAPVRAALKRERGLDLIVVDYLPTHASCRHQGKSGD